MHDDDDILADARRIVRAGKKKDPFEPTAEERKFAAARVREEAKIARLQAKKDVMRASRANRYKDDALYDLYDFSDRIASRDTQLGNAYRAAHGLRSREWDFPTLIYVHGREEFALWNGRFWQFEPLRSERLIALVSNLVLKGIAGEIIAADAEGKDELAERLDAWHKQSQTGYVQRETLWQCRGLPGIGLNERGEEYDGSSFDAHPTLLNCENGVIDLKCGKLLEHNPRYLCTKMAPVAWSQTAEAPQFLQFLADILPSEAVRESVLEMLGYALLGDVKEQRFFVFMGPGANGKSTLIDAVRAVLGPYSAAVTADNLSAKHNSGNDRRDFLADVDGARLCVLNEWQGEERMNTGLLKEMVGGAMLKYRRPGAPAWVEFPMRATLFFCLNDFPTVGADKALFRRAVVIPFDRELREDEIDRDLGRRLQEEKSGILGLLVRACWRYLQRGKLEFPREIKAQSDDWRTSADPFPEFCEAYLEWHPENMEFQIPLKKLHGEFELWRKANFDSSLPMSIRKMAARLRAMKKLVMLDRRKTAVVHGVAWLDACPSEESSYRGENGENEINY